MGLLDAACLGFWSGDIEAFNGFSSDLYGHWLDWADSQWSFTFSLGKLGNEVISDKGDEFNALWPC